MDLEAIRDGIYEAAVIPSQWPAVLDSVAEIAGAAGSILIADNPHDPAWLNSPNLDGFLQDFMAGEWGKVDSRMPRLLSANHAGFLLEEDVFTREELSKDPLIQDFLRPRGFGWATATFVPQVNGGNLVLSVERRFEDGPVPREAVRALDNLRGDIARAAKLSASVGLGRGRVAVDVLCELEMAAGVVSRNGRLTVVNEKLKGLMPAIVRDGRERVALAEPEADRRLAELIGANGPAKASSIPIRRHGAQPPHLAQLIPLRGAANDVFSGGVYILTLTSVASERSPAPTLLRSLFKLTPAEARVLSALAEGKAPADIAEAHRTSLETVRTQLKSVFRKTDTKRQADLVRLIAGLGAAAPSPS